MNHKALALDLSRWYYHSGKGDTEMIGLWEEILFLADT